jgi:hypothetical protein
MYSSCCMCSTCALGSELIVTCGKGFAPRCMPTLPFVCAIQLPTPCPLFGAIMTLVMNYETGVSVDGSRDMESESESEKSSALVAVAPVRMALEVAPSRKKQYVWM